MLNNHACYIKGPTACSVTVSESETALFAFMQLYQCTYNRFSSVKNLYVPVIGINSGLKGGCTATCNGQSGLFQLSCAPVLSVQPSTKPKKRSHTPLGLCPSGLNACPINASSGGYECIDLKDELESCGACGNDCTTIKGARDVACVSGKCVVQSCASRFRLFNDECVRTTATRRTAQLL